MFIHFKNRLVSIELKTIVFMIVDLIMVYLLTLFWFKYIEGVKSPIQNSIKYTLFVNGIFMIYYFIFEYFWN